METNSIKVKKGTGEIVDFDVNKLSGALKRSGANDSQIQSILIELQPQMFNGITTKKIYQLAYNLLKKKSHYVAGRYRLKKAIMELGPTGYPFEHFVGKLFESEGYAVNVGQVMQGKCIQHEVDVIATKPTEKVLVECKFHSDNSRKSDVRVALYIHSRFQDLKSEHEKTGHKHRGMVVCNTRFSDDAMQFAECAGLELISWDYPAGKSLKEWVDRSHLHPITSLHTLKKREKQQLLQKGIVLCRELVSEPELLATIGMKSNQVSKAIKEAKTLINS